MPTTSPACNVVLGGGISSQADSSAVLPWWHHYAVSCTDNCSSRAHLKSHLVTCGLPPQTSSVPKQSSLQFALSLSIYHHRRVGGSLQGNLWGNLIASPSFPACPSLLCPAAMAAMTDDCPQASQPPTAHSSPSPTRAAVAVEWGRGNGRGGAFGCSPPPPHSHTLGNTRHATRNTTSVNTIQCYYSPHKLLLLATRQFFIQWYCSS